MSSQLKIIESSFVLLVLLTTLFFYAVLTSVWAMYPSLTAQRSFLTFTLPIAILLIVSIDESKTTTFRLISEIMVVFGTLFAAIGIGLFLFGDIGTSGGRTVQYVAIGPLEISQNVYGRENRISSLLGNPNTLSGFFVASIPLTLIKVFKGDLAVIYVPSILLQVIALSLSGSRTGFASSIFAIALILSFKNVDSIKNPIHIIKTAIVVLLLAVGTMAILPVQRIFEISQEDAGRVDMWASIWDYFMLNPQGAGHGISREAIPGVTRSPHSDYFALLGELGLIGVVLFVLIIGSTTLYGLRKYIRAPETDQLYLIGALAVFLAFTIHGFAETTITRGGGRQLYWAYFLAFIVCYDTNRKESNDEYTTSSK